MENLLPLNGYINITNEDGLATLTFGHPSHNALSSVLLKTITKHIDHFRLNGCVKVILLKSMGNNTFCAGANFDELLAVKNEAEGKQFFAGFANLINAIRKAGKPVIARVQGKAIGGAVGLIAACDYAFATENSWIKLSELSLGIGPFVIAPAVKRKIGLAAFSELALNPENFKSADWAFTQGLYQSISANLPDLDTHVSMFCQKLCAYSPSALEAWKQDAWQGTEEWDTLLLQQAAISAKLLLNLFTKDQLKKFKEKRLS